MICNEDSEGARHLGRPDKHEKYTDNVRKANPKNVDGVLAAEKDMSPELGKKVSALGGERGVC